MEVFIVTPKRLQLSFDAVAHLLPPTTTIDEFERDWLAARVAVLEAHRTGSISGPMSTSRNNFLALLMVATRAISDDEVDPLVNAPGYREYTRGFKHHDCDECACRHGNCTFCEPCGDCLAEEKGGN